MSIKLDSYTVKARLTPALLTALPFSVVISGTLPMERWWENALWLLFVESGGAMALAQLGRDFGKKKEPALFEKWGGTPTTKFLRYRDNSIGATTKKRYHDKLEALIPNLQMPTYRDEEKNPKAADEVYISAVRYLRENTRDQSKFSLLFDELVNYGFRRNLYGMKAIGITLSTIGIVACGLFAIDIQTMTIVNVYSIICSGVNALILVLWIAVITSDWVRIPANAYAERLLASLDSPHLLDNN